MSSDKQNNCGLPSNLNDRIQDIQKKRSVAKKDTKPKNLRLPNWPEAVRSIPNPFLRSALFSVRKTKCGTIPYLEQQEIYSQKGVSIYYTGALLSQYDLDVWQTIMHIANKRNSSEISCTGYEMIKILDKTDTSYNRNKLDSSLSRMKATGLKIKFGNYSYEGSLINDVYRDESDKRNARKPYTINLNPKLQTLFGPNQFTQIQWNIRRALAGKPIAQWLYGYYTSHANPHPLKPETIRKLSGSNAQKIGEFKDNLLKSFQIISNVSSKFGQTFNAEIKDDGLIYVTTHKTKTKKKFLAKHPRKILPSNYP